MSEYDVITKSVQFDPSMMKNGIGRGNVKLSQADKEFFEWVEKNAQAGRTYTTPSGHIVSGDEIIRSREFTRNITDKIRIKDVATKFIKRAKV